MFFLQPYQTNLLMKCTRFISSALLCISSDEMLSVFGVEQQIPSICCTLWNDAVEEYSEDIAVSLPSLQETEVSGMGLTGCSSAFEPSLALVSSDFFSFAPSIPFVCWLALLAKLRTLFYSRHFSKSRLVLHELPQAKSGQELALLSDHRDPRGILSCLTPLFQAEIKLLDRGVKNQGQTQIKFCFKWLLCGCYGEKSHYSL